MQTQKKSYPRSLKPKGLFINKLCFCCHSELRLGLDSWHWLCTNCGYEAGHFLPCINDAQSNSLIDESRRENGLKSLREQNFRELLQLILKYAPKKKSRLLDVGAAHGWFVKMASGHFEALGIEPDQAICKKAIEQGIPMMEGYFPEVVGDKERFDVIVFNDVLEHIPDVDKTLQACKKHLADGGLLVINLPSSNGFFYKTSKLLKRLGLNVEQGSAVSAFTLFRKKQLY
jgi:SAM-dependent methyltransferase